MIQLSLTTPEIPINKFYSKIINKFYPKNLALRDTQPLTGRTTKKRKNGDISLTRPGQKKENTKTDERTTPWQKYERQKKTGGKEEREKRIFE